jgi:hypothetical protein
MKHITAACKWAEIPLGGVGSNGSRRNTAYLQFSVETKPFRKAGNRNRCSSVTW